MTHLLWGQPAFSQVTAQSSGPRSPCLPGDQGVLTLCGPPWNCKPAGFLQDGRAWGSRAPSLPPASPSGHKTKAREDISFLRELELKRDFKPFSPAGLHSLWRPAGREGGPHAQYTLDGLSPCFSPALCFRVFSELCKCPGAGFTAVHSPSMHGKLGHSALSGAGEQSGGATFCTLASDGNGHPRGTRRA